MRLIDRLRADPRVDELLVEEGTPGHRASYLVRLNYGWQFGAAHHFGEDTLKAVQRALKTVGPCDCAECREFKPRDGAIIR